MLTRREFVKLGAGVGAGMLLPIGWVEKAFAYPPAVAAIPANAALVPKYLDRLPTNLGLYAPLLPSASTTFHVGAFPFQASVHSTAYPAVNVWGYRAQGDGVPTAVQDSYLGPAFVVKKGVQTKVKWYNNLAGIDHPLPVDPSLHWADPEEVGKLATYPAGFTYTLHNVPIVPHVHGAEVRSASDGGPDAWFTPKPDPAAVPWTPGDPPLLPGEIPWVVGPTFKQAGDGGSAGDLYTYDNAQPTATIWYHDHALGITRLNVYMGMAGAYLVVDPADVKATKYLPFAFRRNPDGSLELDGAGDPVPDTDAFGNLLDVPLVIQDRMFDTTGQLYFPAITLNSATNPFWVPEFFGDHILVNGKAWPHMPVEQRGYRFRILNGSNARFYDLSFLNKTNLAVPPLFQVIATDGGYLNTPSPVRRLVIAPGERIEVVVDFSAMPAGTVLQVKNVGAIPYPAGANPDPRTTGRVMEFRVQASAAGAQPVQWPAAPIVINSSLAPYPSITDTPVRVRSMTLNEWMNMATMVPFMATVNNTKWPHMGEHPATEDPANGSTEIWEIINTTGDAHPMHTHLTQFQLISRQAFDPKAFGAAYIAAFGGMDPGMMDPMGPPYEYKPDGAGLFQPNPMYEGMAGYATPPALPKYSRTLSLAAGVAPITVAEVLGGNPDIVPFLKGKPKYAAGADMAWKDTLQMFPGEVTRILVRWKPIDGTADYPFDPTMGPGYVWHCHIIDHEDNEMMRPYHVT